MKFPLFSRVFLATSLKNCAQNVQKMTNDYVANVFIDLPSGDEQEN